MRAPRALTAAIAVVPAVVFFAAPTYPQYDSYFHLVWGRGLLHGTTPDFEAYAAPTQHPIYVALGALASLLGTTGGERALVALTLLSLSALVIAVSVLGARLFASPWPGVAAALFVGSSFALLLYAVRAYVDVPFLALVAWGAVLAVDARRVPAMAVLFVAGLLRPEAWVLAALWWLWTVRGAGVGERVVLTLLAAGAPVLWALVDALVTGDPLHSLHATSSLAETLGRERGVAKVPRALVAFLFDVARPPVALLGVAGVVLAVRRFGARAMAVPLALLATGVLTFVGTGIAGLSILPRYLTVPVVALCLFAGYGLLGFTSAPPGRERDRWRRAAIAATVLGVVFLAVKAPSFGKLRDELRFVRSSHRDLVALLHDRRVVRAARCGPITFPTYRLVPDTRWLLDAGPSRTASRSVSRARRGVAVVVVGGDKARRRYAYADGVSRSTVPAPPGFREIARTPTFAAYARCG